MLFVQASVDHFIPYGCFQDCIVYYFQKLYDGVGRLMRINNKIEHTYKLSFQLKHESKSRNEPCWYFIVQNIF